MSRIGKKPINIPDKVQVTFTDDIIKAKGPLGELEYRLPAPIEMNMEQNVITFTRPNDEKHVRALHGLSRALTSNIIEGVSRGFEKLLQIEGVGFKAEMKGTNLMLSLGFSHPILVVPPKGITFEVPTPTSVKIKGIDKYVIGLLAAKIRKIRPPEPYKGKGVRYQGEYIRRKAGKTSAK